MALSPAAYSKETGGLSGPPLLPFSLRTLLTLRTLLPASIPLIGCGGISSGHDALQYAQAGATCVQLYTSFAYGGPGVPRRVKDELAEELNILGKSWKEVTQEAINTLSWKEEDSEEMLRAQTEALKAEALQLLEILRRLEGGENVANV
jgi:dihydroorotate dehydrogenase